MNESTNNSKHTLDQLCINTIRFLSVDAVQKANSGHPGLPLGAAPMAYTLWDRFLKHNPADPLWFDRDRFVLSAGHGSALLYSLLHLTGYALPMEQIKQFRQWNSMTPGHPERGLTPGVEVTTGPLGQGFGNGVGMAIAQAYLAARYNRPGFEIINHYTYALVSDGDMMEGVSAEAAPLAGHLKLGKLIYLYDDNRITLAASTQVTFTENHVERFNAYGWHTQRVEDGNDVEAIDKAIRAAQDETEKPSLILVRTHIGYGSPEQDSFKAHGSPLGVEDVKKTKEKLGWPLEPDFLVPEEAGQHMCEAITRGNQKQAEWKKLFAEYEKKYPELAAELNQIIVGELPKDWEAKITEFPADAKGMATRVASGKVMQALASVLPSFIGGSADLNSSTHTELKGLGNFGDPSVATGDMQGSAEGGWSFAGRNLQFGVREHGMGAITNGLAAHGGIIPFCSTFFIFSDYMRPTIRLAAIMNLHVVYVFTHDSIALGEDGTTHQPVEQLASLRAMPELTLIRPADANETAVAWRIAIKQKKRPVALVLTRQDLPVLDRKQYSSADGVEKGAYILSDAPDAKPQLILIASGSEVNLILNAAKKLKEENKIAVRVVSMPSWDLFEEQSHEYRDSVLPPDITTRLAVEAGAAQGWERYTGCNGDALAINKFGSSAPAEVLLKEYGFTVENVCKRALVLLEKNKK